MHDQAAQTQIDVALEPLIGDLEKTVGLVKI